VWGYSNGGLSSKNVQTLSKRYRHSDFLQNSHRRVLVVVRSELKSANKFHGFLNSTANDLSANWKFKLEFNEPNGQFKPIM